ncbi:MULTISPECIES: hypothetical protein [Curtobacterium]|uniref:Uncharacterized protein n=1 Tax=Curtobacterium citri TaxID=3055139 RepID=A0ABT7T9B0_9MICO|nr:MULTISPECIES: hypothetical protein [Curtobacterium]MDM7886162.1 hypothetical protein [Curtobacterium citri]
MVLLLVLLWYSAVLVVPAVLVVRAVLVAVRPGWSSGTTRPDG